MERKNEEGEGKNEVLKTIYLKVSGGRLPQNQPLRQRHVDRSHPKQNLT
jgi:hypothetical protein